MVKCRFTTLDQSEKTSRNYGGNELKKEKSVPSAGKIITTVFWESKGVFLISYLHKDKTIKSEDYCNLLHHLDAKICQEKPALKKNRNILH